MNCILKVFACAVIYLVQMEVTKKRPVAVLGETRPANPDLGVCGGSPGLEYLRLSTRWLAQWCWMF